jgi:hypothetical protein
MGNEDLRQSGNGGKRPGGLAILFAIVTMATAPALMHAQGQAQTQASIPTQAPDQTTASSEAPGKTLGNYNVQESIEGGYRDSMINGNTDNYDTFNNLQSGWRLFDYTLNMRSLNHEGVFFDDLVFSNFGYGGDPNDVSRLRIDKNKWYDFRGMFRRDKNVWDYNLLANPLNLSTSVLPTAITNSPHALYLSRRMQDYDVTLLPQSRIRFRAGYSRNSNGGPAFTTLDGGTEPILAENLTYLTNSWRMGADYVGLPKTTLSFDEYLTYTHLSDHVTDQNLTYQLSNGTPVDLGMVFIGTTPCAKPITNAATVPPTVTPTCNGFLSYGQMQDPRSSFSTEQFRFQTTYVRNLSLTGSAAYSGGDNMLKDFDEVANGWTSRTLLRESTVAGPAQAKRVTVRADFTAEYRLTDKLSVIDEFNYNNWRNPSMWATADTNLFATPPGPGQSGMLLPIAMVTPANFAAVCPLGSVLNGYNGPNCPQHVSGSGADVTNELVSQFLAQNIRDNTVELKYDFTPRLTGIIGYMFMARTIADFSATFDTGEIYFPGGPTGNAANLYLAARGDCALVSGVLPAACFKNPDGSVQEGTLANPVAEAGNDAARTLYEIHENAATLDVSARPTDAWRINADLMFGYNNNSFTRISPRQLQSYKIHATYRPTPWWTMDAAIDIHENRDNVSTVNNLEHGRTYSLIATLAPNEKLWFDVGYHYMDVFTQTLICFPEAASAAFSTPCPAALATGSGELQTASFYSSKDNYLYGDVMWKPVKRVTTMFGYAGSIVRGTSTLLSPVAPTGTLDFDYLTPFASLTIDVYKGISYKTAWNYYGYDDRGIANPAGLVPLPSQTFDANNVTISVRYAF